MDFKVIAADKGPKSYYGFIWVAVLTGALLILVYGTDLIPHRKEDKQPKKQESPPAHRERSRTTKIGSVWSEPEAQREQGEIPRYLTDPSILEHTGSSAVVDTYPFYYLLYQAKTADLARLSKAARPVPGRAEIANWDPGTPVSLQGTILSIKQRKDLCIPEAEIPHATQYEIKDDDGGLYLVFTVYRVRGLTSDDKVKVVGRYLRLYPKPNMEAGGEASYTPTPLIVARQVDGSRYADDRSCLEQVTDGTFGHEVKAFFYLANLVRGLSQEELKRRADETLTPRALQKSPAAARGRFVGVQGLLILTQEVRDTPNIAGVERFYWCIVRTRDDQWFWVYTLEEPKGFERDDMVKVYGVFLKSRRYVSRGKFERTALLVMARRLTRLEYSGTSSLAVATLIGGIIVIVGLTVVVVIERRKGREFGGHVRRLSARNRPQNLNQTARALTSRRRGTNGAQSAPGQEQNTSGEDGRIVR